MVTTLIGLYGSQHFDILFPIAFFNPNLFRELGEKYKDHSINEGSTNLLSMHYLSKPQSYWGLKSFTEWYLINECITVLYGFCRMIFEKNWKYELVNE
jgi:hypothetical protein